MEHFANSFGFPYVPSVDSVEKFLELNYNDQQHWMGQYEWKSSELAVHAANSTNDVWRDWPYADIDRFQEAQPKLIAAQYADHMGHFRYVDALCSHFPRITPQVVEQAHALEESDPRFAENPLGALLYTLAQKRPKAAVRAWEWCVMNFYPYRLYSWYHLEMLNGVINVLSLMPHGFLAALCKRMAAQHDFAQIVAAGSPQSHRAVARCLVEMLRAGNATAAENLMEHYQESVSRTDDETCTVVKWVFRQCAELDDPRALHLLRERVFPKMQQSLFYAQSVYKATHALLEQLKPDQPALDLVAPFDLDAPPEWHQKYLCEKSELVLEPSDFLDEWHYLHALDQKLRHDVYRDIITQIEAGKLDPPSPMSIDELAFTDYELQYDDTSFTESYISDQVYQVGDKVMVPNRHKGGPAEREATVVSIIRQFHTFAPLLEEEYNGVPKPYLSHDLKQVKATNAHAVAAERRKHRLGILCAVLAACCYGLLVPLSRLMFTWVSPLMLAAFLCWGAGIGSFMFRATRKMRGTDTGKLRTDGRTLLYLSLSVVTNAATLIALFIGLHTLSTASVSLLGSYELAATLLLALHLRSKPIHKRSWIGIGAVTLGCLPLLFMPTSSGFVFVNGSLFALIAFAIRGYAEHCGSEICSYDRTHFVAVNGVLSGLLLLIFALTANNPLPQPAAILPALFLGFVVFGLSAVLRSRAQVLLSRAKANAYYAIAPFVGAALSLLLFGEAVTLPFIGALLLMIAGVWMVYGDSRE